MGRDPYNRGDRGVHRRSLGRWAWVPIPVLLAVMIVLWAAGWRGSHESVYLLLTLSLVFSLLVCLVVAYLIARSFLVRATPGLLLLGCGVVIWGPAGVVATAVGRGDPNVGTTIYNSCVWLSGLCHLLGVSLSLRPGRSLSPPAVWLLAGYLPAVAAVVLVTLSGLAGWMPTFFVEDQGGTPVRQAVLISAILMFALTALLLGVARSRPVSAFAYWYALALWLITAGLLGVALPAHHASILSWTGRATQALGGLYMLIAAVVSVRESRVWGICVERALREERDFNAAALDTAGALVVVLDDQGRITRFNRACERLTGYTAAEVYGRVFWDFPVPPDDTAAVRQVWNALAGGSSLIHHENHWLTRDGTRRLIDWSSTALVDETGHVHHFAAVGIDVSDRQRTQESLQDANEDLRAKAEQLQTLNDMLKMRQRELQAANEDLRAQEQELRGLAEALRESEERYRTLFDAAPDAIIVHRNGRLLHANKAALRLTAARSFQELARHTVLDFFGPEARERARGRIRMAMAGRRLSTREATLRRLDGRDVAVEFRTTRVDFQGARAIQTIARDITERRQAEKALQELNAALERKVAERTAELEHRASQLQKLTLELSQAEERELKRVAEILHEDLQQQIAGAKFQVNLLNSASQDDPSRQLTAAQINQILKDAIGMSRSLSHELSPAVFYDNDLGEALEWLGQQVKTKHHVTVHIQVSGEGTLRSEVLTVFLFRAGRELLSNVVRHAGVHAAGVRLRRVGRYVGLRVSDQGHGFDPQELKQASGFGLLSIRERVELLGGRVKIASVKGRGTKVQIVVPDVGPERDTPA